MDLDDLRSAIAAKRLRITDHADEEAANDRLTLDEILKSVDNGETIEHYPTDKPYPICLILGQAENGQPVHSV